MRCGRPRRNGHREANGRLCRLKAAERDAGIAEKVTVLRQSHRLGDLDQLVESPIGRFVLRHKLHRAIYDAALEWGILARHYQAAKIGTKAIISIGFGSGAGVSPAKSAWLSKELARIEQPLKKLNPLGFSAVRTLSVYEREIAIEAEPAAVVVLMELGQLLRKTGRR